MSNPFNPDPNPFADPAVTAHTDNAGDEGYGDVAPAGGNSAWGTPAGGAWSSPPPAQPTPTRASPRNGREDERKPNVDQREVELQKREAALAQREREAQRREAAVSGLPQKNWPPCSPVLYHDIEAEVPASLQGIVKRAYYSYLLFCLTVVLNFAVITLSFTGSAPGIVSWVFSGIFVAAGVPGAFLFWYGRLYNAAARDRTFTYMCFFIGYMIHVAFCLWGAIAVPILNKDSFCGFFRMISVFSNSKWLGVLYIIVFILWVGNVLISIYVWQQVMRDFRGRGGPEKARNEATTAAGRVAIQGAMNARV